MRMGLGLSLKKRGPSGPSYGPELVANGTFATDIANWTTTGGATWVAGKLRVTSAGSDNGATQNAFGLNPGGTYRFQATMVPSETDRARISIAIGATAQYLYAVVGGTVDATFVATGTGVAIVLEAANAGAWASAGQFAEFDNVSLRQVL